MKKYKKIIVSYNITGEDMYIFHNSFLEIKGNIVTIKSCDIYVFSLNAFFLKLEEINEDKVSCEDNG